MRRLFDLLLILIVIVLWKSILAKETIDNNNYENHFKSAIEYEQMEAYIDALDEYEKAYKYANNSQKKEVNSSKFNILIKQGELKKAKDELDYLEKNNNDIEDLANNYLEKCFSIKEYASYNKFIKEYENSLDLDEYKEKIKFELIETSNEYEEIKQMGKDFFLVLENGQEYIIDANSRVVFKCKDGQILGFDETNKLVSIKEGDTIRVVDFQKNIRTKYPSQDSSIFILGYYTVRGDEYILKNQLNSELINAQTIGTFSENKNFFIESDLITVINERLETINKFNGNSVKVNQLGQGIFDDKLIVISDAQQMIDTINAKISEKYEEIDFSKSDLIAVKSNGKWGYMNKNFEIEKEAEYDYAKSFSKGVGVVKIGDRIGLIDDSFDEPKIINCDELTQFNENGIAFIKKNGKWKMVKLAKEIDR